MTSTKYLLDTNICIAIMADHAAVRTRLNAVPLIVIATPSVVAHELWFGVHKSRKPEVSTQRTVKFFDLFPTVLPFGHNDAEKAAEIRSDLQSRNQTIGPYDTLIAGQALARGLTLVTANEREFSRVRGLLWENWLKTG